VISEGQGISAIADVLKAEGIIDSKFAFVAYTIVSGNEKNLQAGKYVFEPGVTIPVIVRSMSEGFAEPDDIVITIPEGFNVFDIDKRLASFGLIKGGEFAGKYYADEGQFFPDTYYIENQNTKIKNQNDGVKIKNDREMVKRIGEKMMANFANKVGEISRGDLILASMLEKEARKEEDMRLIAGIIENRLERGMLLQIDAAVSYGACLRNLQSATYPFDKLRVPSLSKDNLQLFRYCDVSQVGVANEIKIDGPYNTYTRAGLPPGPIANPGITAIRAVLNPTKSDYLYYLSTRDGSQLVFSKTGAEHAANRRKYLGI